MKVWLPRILLGGFLAVILLVATVILLPFMPWPQPSANEVLNSILKPMPEGTIADIQLYSNPSMGDGLFVADLQVTDHGLEEILNNRAWTEISLEEASWIISAIHRMPPENAAIYELRLSNVAIAQLVVIDKNNLKLAAQI